MPFQSFVKSTDCGTKGILVAGFLCKRQMKMKLYNSPPWGFEALADFRQPDDPGEAVCHLGLVRGVGGGWLQVLGKGLSSPG